MKIHHKMTSAPGKSVQLAKEEYGVIRNNTEATQERGDRKQVGKSEVKLSASTLDYAAGDSGMTPPFGGSGRWLHRGERKDSVRTLLE